MRWAECFRTTISRAKPGPRDSLRAALREGAAITTYQAPTSGGMLGRGAVRYQVLVPSYTVMFAYFLVLTVGWLFVAERRQGTLKRLRAVPLLRSQILIGKLIPCFMLSIGQGLFLLARASSCSP